VRFEQPCSELEISARLEEESCVVSVQPLAQREVSPASPVLRPVSTSSSAVRNVGTLMPCSQKTG
jgi:hypothetical protein